MTEADSIRFCLACREFLPISRFYFHSGRFRNSCIPCHRAKISIRPKRSYDDRPRLADLINFFSQVHVNYESIRNGSPCWDWIGTVTGKLGYGVTMFRQRRHSPHNLAYEWFVGEVDKSLVRDHLCSRPVCVNPSHLEQVDQRTNVLRSKGLGAVNARKTHCPQGHPYTPENTYITKLRQRNCRACAREQARKKREEKTVHHPY